MATKPATAADKASSLAAIQRKLDRWELLHLRQHALDLSERLDIALQAADSAQSQADYWREQCFELMEDLQASGNVIGLTKSGEIWVVQ